MAWTKKDPNPYRHCVMCGNEFVRSERGWSAITCGEECAHARHLKLASAYQAAHPEQNRRAVASYRVRNREAFREQRRRRRERAQHGA